MTEINTKRTRNAAETAMQPYCDISTPRCRHLIEKAIYTFKEKLIRCGYNNMEIENILSKSEKIIEEKMAKKGFAILWTIDLHEPRSKKPIQYTPTKKAVEPPDSLIDTFKKIGVDIDPLGHYELLVDYNNGVFVSEKKGVRPHVVFQIQIAF